VVSEKHTFLLFRYLTLPLPLEQWSSAVPWDASHASEEPADETVAPCQLACDNNCHLFNTSRGWSLLIHCHL